MMISSDDVRDLNLILNTVAVPLIGYVAWTVRDLRVKIQLQNNRITKMETWKDGHEKIDDERHDEIKRRFEEEQ